LAAMITGQAWPGRRRMTRVHIATSDRYDLTAL
jgi:hypothetical protein